MAFGTQVRGFKPDRSRRNFQGEKKNFQQAFSFGGEVKPWVPCRRFTACKKSHNATWKSGHFQAKFIVLFFAHVVLTLAARIS
jgi:hypothetical protein